ncbi:MULTISPECIES: recombinase family protein [Phyllobacteriaceae]|uniref:Resolvase/invertase-type recombinase catalytic domain-containing protein n=1 Tax=Mesorhizobium hungaricum TaxID=1566387 RepID=A0A1C2EFE8_9HYPH|nr:MULTISPECIES: recombinase family protein [Mesorhizobium]MDQ0328152.1 DNA invertase Pin-like site-specific DNA recombinase [Mesorhizobium sp. YL-MeA3-2017]OCX25581.1 hypothetical protein QV13_00265 [Mesorhizobium hungaricum]
MTLDELNIEIHLAKEGMVLSRDSRSSEKFIHGIKVLMAKNYIDNLSEEARKGRMEKAEQGIWPSKAPLGYINYAQGWQEGHRTSSRTSTGGYQAVRALCDWTVFAQGTH